MAHKLSLMNFNDALFSVSCSKIIGLDRAHCQHLQPLIVIAYFCHDHRNWVISTKYGFQYRTSIGMVQLICFDDGVRTCTRSSTLLRIECNQNWNKYGRSESSMIIWTPFEVTFYQLIKWRISPVHCTNGMELNLNSCTGSSRPVGFESMEM